MSSSPVTILPFPGHIQVHDENEGETPREFLLPWMRDALAEAAFALDNLYDAFDSGFRPYVRNEFNNIDPDVRSLVEEAALKAKALRYLLNDLKATLPVINELFPEER